MERLRRIRLDRFPGGKMHAVTFSYDDGRIQDKKLVKLFNDNGLKGTFHLNSSDMTVVYDFLKSVEYVLPEEIKEVYKGHEVSCHTETHPYPCDVPSDVLLQEIIRNKAFLEKYSGGIVRGMSYPFGQCDDRIVSICRTAGMEYSRTANSTKSFFLPGDFMRWEPSFHHSEVSSETVDSFLAKQKCPQPRLLNVWGHSYEFDEYGGWNKFVNFSEYISGHDEIWYATNIEIVDYISAARSLRFSADASIVYNPSAIDVWFSVDGETVCVKSGESIAI